MKRIFCGSRRPSTESLDRILKVAFTHRDPDRELRFAVVEASEGLGAQNLGFEVGRIE